MCCTRKSDDTELSPCLESPSKTSSIALHKWKRYWESKIYFLWSCETLPICKTNLPGWGFLLSWATQGNHRSHDGKECAYSHAYSGTKCLVRVGERSCTQESINQKKNLKYGIFINFIDTFEYYITDLFNIHSRKHTYLNIFNFATIWNKLTDAVVISLHINIFEYLVWAQIEWN